MEKQKLVKLAERLSVPTPIEMGSFETYDFLHCNFSGGKDSIALVLLLLYGYKVPKEKLQLIHMRVDGSKKKNTEPLFDWEQTDEYLDYCANKLDLPLIVISSPKGMEERILDRGLWPAPSQQFCTSYQKRDVYAKWVRSLGPGRYLCLSGERAAESTRRKQNLERSNFRIYTSANAPTKQRFVDWYRPIHHLQTDEVWELMRLADIEPHPCYQYVSRCSCKFCIFLSPYEMKKVAELYPDEFQRLVDMEKQMGHTMKYDKNGPISLVDFIKKANTSDDQLTLDLPCVSW
ncbi:phosphoadenosine phosphosulfate reductase domain-containing protein [Sutcliffiella cohnii]|uniref:phosphoadenosine phosphosulfate reductase domain-containing protein n=1 Tax=Sutcliffiella cohnii TaxID=33932 RepID=UPI0008360DA8|nr:phosphoadenosine phosphosulfate reductase family protein [Sutcliffiella cohnii]